MNIKNYLMVILVPVFVLAAKASANEDEKQPIYKQILPYVGIGYGKHEAGSFEDANGYQLFIGGYAPLLDLDLGGQSVRFAAEAGYQDTGDFKVKIGGRTYKVGGATGLWVSPVAFYDIPGVQGLAAMARLGVDFGDDDGPLYGFGIEYALRHALKKDIGIALRAEIVKRSDVDSFQLNAVYTF